VTGALARHGWRFASFSGIGAFVLIFGIAFQAVLVHFGTGAYGSYAGQIVVSIELSFVLNWRFTWESRKVGFWRSAWKFNAQKLALTVPNVVLYVVLIRAGLGWLPANLAITALFTAVNYATGDLWSFARPPGARRLGRARTTTPEPPPVRAVLPPGRLPTASVIIPCKGSQATIRATVNSLLAQDYPGLVEIILVGDVGDATWMALQDVRDPRLVILEQEAIPGKRDPNAKRDAGISKTTGDILALVDSDVVVQPGWLSRAVAMLLAEGGGLVAGGMRSIHDTFWGRFVDRNVLAAKTPRLARPYHVTAENFGRHGYKPPVTANAVFTRELYESCSLDVGWAYGYEDYEWFWRVVKSGHPILFSGTLTAAHHHRRSFRHLVREYKQSARGCAHFIRRHPDSPLARKRRIQGLLLPPVGTAAAAAAIAASVAGQGLITAVLLAAVLTCLGAREAARSRSLEALVYPPATLALGWVYATTIAGGLARNRPITDPAPLWDDTPPSWWRRIGSRISWPLTGILACQAAFSLSLVWSNSAFADEADYLWQGHLEWAHWLHGYPIPALYDSGAAQLYPALGALADSVGGLAGTRILSLCFMLAANALLFLTARHLFGLRAAVVASALWGVSEPVLRLAFATYDPLACFLVTLAAWLAIQAGLRKQQAELVIAASVSLAAASVVAFSFAIMIPAVITVAYLVWYPRLGRRLALWCTGWLAGCTGVLACAALIYLHLWAAFFGSTVTRGGEGLGYGVTAVVRAAWSWDGPMFAIACAGVVLAFAYERTLHRKLLLLALVGGGVLVPAYQTYLGTSWSMDKHMSASTWFLALAAGYAACRVPRPEPKPIFAAFAGIALMSYPAFTGLWYARSTFASWPDTSSLVAALQPVVAESSAPLLTNDSWVLSYYLPADRAPGRVLTPVATSTAKIAAGGFAGAAFVFSGSPLAEEAVQAKDPAAVEADLLQLTAGDSGLYAVVRALDQSPLYRITAVLPYTTSNPADGSGLQVVWQRASGEGASGQ
jgi:putative flippase GtrA/GT2 family glycosyltransferase